MTPSHLPFILAFLAVLGGSVGQSGAAPQTCAAYTFSDNKSFKACIDLPVLSSYLHWTYNASAATVELAYRHTSITTTGQWVSWGINPVSDGMVGAQCLVATIGSNGNAVAYTSPVTTYDTGLDNGRLSFDVMRLTAVYADMEVILFATLAVPGNKTKVNHVWQDGPLSPSGVPFSHVTYGPNMRSSGSLDFLAGAQTPQGNGGDREEDSHNKRLHNSNENNAGFKLIGSDYYLYLLLLVQVFFVGEIQVELRCFILH